MSFWETSTGEDVAKTATGSYEIGGGKIIPDNSTVFAEIENATWAKDVNFNKYIEIVWTVTKPEAAAGAKIWHKLWVADADLKAKKPEEKRDKARKMLANIDANAGGKLVRNGREPDDDDLALALNGKAMAIKVKIWEIGGSVGNWVAAVLPKETALVMGTAPVPVSQPQPSANGYGGAAGGDSLDDDIPF